MDRTLMEILPIASSSDGNCTWISTGRTAVLIDCGVPLKVLRARLGDEKLRSLDAVFITHEHYDHIKCLGTIGRRYAGLPVYINSRSYSIRNGSLKGILRRPLEKDVPVPVGCLTLTPIELEHDSKNIFGFNIRQVDGGNLCYLTDTGHVNGEISEILKDSDNLFIESNYDELLLTEYSGYPNYLKERIRSFHMGNRQTLNLIDEIGIESFENIILAHLSPRTNSPVHVRRLYKERFPEHVDRFRIAPLDEPLEL